MNYDTTFANADDLVDILELLTNPSIRAELSAGAEDRLQEILEYLH